MTTMTGKEQQAADALEAARQEGATLTAYAKAKGLVIGELYNTLAGLRRKGLLPRTTRRPRSKFVAVRVEAPPPILDRAPGVVLSCAGSYMPTAISSSVRSGRHRAG
jgi:hypothetical protein